MLESSIEQYLVKQVKDKGGLCIKLVPMFFAGLPDRLILMPRARICFIETKAPKLNARKLQRIVHKMLTDLGFKVYVVDSRELVDKIINSMLD